MKLKKSLLSKLKRTPLFTFFSLIDSINLFFLRKNILEEDLNYHKKSLTEFNKSLTKLAMIDVSLYFFFFFFVKPLFFIEENLSCCNHYSSSLRKTLTLIRLGFLKVGFSGEKGGQFDPIHISRRTYLTSI